MRKRAAIELSIGTIVIIVLAISMLILGLVLVKNILSEPKFRITTENCTDEQEFSFLFSKERLNEKNISLEDFEYVTYLYMDDMKIECPKAIEDCFAYGIVPICEDVEVGMNWKEECLEVFEGENMKPDCFFGDVEWLEENCKPYECYYEEDTSVDLDGDCESGYDWARLYKCGDYTVEVLK